MPQPTIPETPQVPQPTPPKPKTNLYWIILIVVAVLVLAGTSSAIWYGQKEITKIQETIVQPSQLSEAREISTVNWQTYRNEEYGYEVKYLVDLVIEHQSAEDPNWPIRDILYIKSSPGSVVPIDWHIEVDTNKDGKTAQQWADQVGTVTPVGNKTITKITVGGIEGRRVVADYYPSDVDSSATTDNIVSIYIVKGEFVYIFVCVNKRGEQNYDHVHFDQILSTFKFIK